MSMSDNFVQQQAAAAAMWPEMQEAVVTMLRAAGYEVHATGDCLLCTPVGARPRADLQLLARHPAHGHYWHDLAKQLEDLRVKLDNMASGSVLPGLTPVAAAEGMPLEFDANDPRWADPAQVAQVGQWLTGDTHEREEPGQPRPTTPQASDGGSGG